MGGRGGGGERTFVSGLGGDVSVPPTVVPTATELVDQEIARTLGEARRVQRLIQTLKDADSDQFVLCALNAGQGDCAVMRLPDGKIIVVDCNARSANVNLLGFLEKAGIASIDLLILTHPDRDHVSGLPSLANGVKIKRVLDGRFRKEDDGGDRTPEYAAYRAALEKLRASGTEFLSRTPVSGDKMELGFASIGFLAPRAPMQAADANEASLAFKVTVCGRSVLFGGDVTTEAWRYIVNRAGKGLASDVFWCSHHGAASGCLPEAVKAIAPRLTIVSVGENTYGHPHADAVKTYEKHSSDVRRTDDGSIGIVSRGGDSWETIV